MNKKKDFFTGLKDSAPVAIGYLPVAITFGLISVQAGLSEGTTILLSAIMFSGASQFMFVAMFASGLPMLFAIISTLTLNLRHLFYGPALSPYLPNSPKALAIISFTLTDEVFAMAHGLIDKIPYKFRTWWFAGLGFGSYFSWITGTTIGAISGQTILNESELAVNSMQIALPSLFLLLLLPHIKSEPKFTLFSSFSIAALASWYGQTAVGIVAAGIIGVILLIGEKKWKTR